jgi:ribosomal protein S18 acetylase RimI-like enzyme
VTDVQGKGFADYDPAARPDRQSAPPVQVRDLAPEDVAACAVLVASRGGSDPATAAERLRRDLADPDRHQFVADSDDGIVGYGAVIRHELLPTAAADTAPSGYYLVGLMIDPRWRRRGIGELAGCSCAAPPVSYRAATLI